jgi:Cof subfamily protein (haloacid dehalogenase superfamily)
MSKKEIKIIFCDVDETLVYKNTVPQANADAIDKLTKNTDIKFVICTGRPFSLAEKIIKEIHLYDKEKEYSICGSGSVIYENKNKKILYLGQLKRDLFQKLFDFAKKFDVYSFFVGLEYFHLYKNPESEIKKRDAENAKYKILDENFNMDELLDGDDKIMRIVYAKDNDIEYLKMVRDEILKNEEYKEQVDCFISSGKYLEINPKGVNKGQAIRWLCNYLNVKKENTMGIGDSDNDIDMLKNVGLGVGVANANENVKKMVDYVCEKNYIEGGVQEAIEKFCF